MMLGIIKPNFKYLTIPTFVLRYNSMVRSHLDYCYLFRHYTEKVQKKATKI